MQASVGSFLELTLLTRSYDGRNCSTGAASFAVSSGLIGPALHPAVIWDRGDGTYGVQVWTGWTAGKYKLELTLDFDRCAGTLGCVCERGVCTVQTVKLGRVGGLQPYHVQLHPLSENHSKQLSLSPVQCRESDGCHAASGYWVKSRPSDTEKPDGLLRIKEALAQSGMVHIPTDCPHQAYQYRWQTGDQSSVAHQGLLRQKLLAKVSNRWLHFIGMSIMQSTVQAVVTQLLLAVEERDGNASFVHSVELPTCAGHTQRRRNYYIQRSNTLITQSCHDDFRTPKKPPLSSRLWLLQGLHQLGWHGFAALEPHGPSALLYGCGLHLVNGLERTGFIEQFYNSEVRTFRNLYAAYGANSTQLIWKSTPTTHWPNATLSPYHLCRTSHRMRCMNALSRNALEMVDEFKPARVWRILDTHTLSAMRPDCVPDNRHYVCGNCESELVLGQFTKALDAMRVESDSFLIALPAVVSSD